MNDIEYDLCKYKSIYEETTIFGDVLRGLELEYFRRILNKHSDILTADKTSLVALDIGTGWGTYPKFLAKNYGIIAWGIDNSEDAVNYATSKPEDNVNIIKMDATNLSFDDNSFDIVTLMTGTFSHFDDSEKSSLLKNISRILKTNGFIVISTWNPECEFTSFMDVYSDQEKEILMQNSISMNELEHLLLGFKIISRLKYCFMSKREINSIDKDVDLIAYDRYFKNKNDFIKGKMYMVVAKII